MAGLLAGLDLEVAAALILLVLLAGILVLRPLLVSIFGQTPFIGGWLVSNIDAGFNAFAQAILPAAEATFWVTGSTIDWLTATWHGILNAAPNFASGVTAAFWRVLTVSIPYQVGVAVAQVEGEIAAARAFLLAAVAAAAATAAAGLAQEAAIRAAAVAAVQAAMIALVGQAEAQAAAAVAAARAYALSLSAADRAFTVHETAQAVAHTDQLFSQSVAIGAAADAALRRDLGAEDQALGRAISSGISSVESQLNAQNVALLGSIAAASAAAAAAVESIENSRCMKVCDPLGAFGEGLQLLDGLALLALVEAITHNPEQMGPALLEVIGPAVEAIGGELQTLLTA